MDGIGLDWVDWKDRIGLDWILFEWIDLIGLDWVELIGLIGLID